MNKYYQFGDFPFLLDYPESLVLPQNLSKFEIEEETHLQNAFYSFHIRLSETLPQPRGTLVFSSDVLLVFQNEQLEERFIGSRLGEGYYAHTKECSSTSTEITLLSAAADYLVYDTVCASLLSLEKHLLSQNSLILHCAYIEHNGKALLFSAPSETGKTTQANLWENYRGAETINGDRALLSRCGDQWYANGWPICGSSGICQNRTLPIHAIILLSQAKDNHAEKMQAVKAFSQLYSQITLNRWNPEAQEKAMTLLESLITELPVYHLACNISEEAVVCLEQKIYDK